MKKIQMVDVKSQYDRIKSEVDAGIQEVIETAFFVKGPKVTEFQKDLERFLGVKHVIPVGNGTDALQISLMSLGLKRGDEVITPTFTFIATAEVVALLGLTPVVVDVDPDTFCMSLESVEKAITPKTKAIVPVHLFGQNAEMEGILELAAKHHLYLVEDACQSINSEYTFSDGRVCMSGCMGNMGCTSFFPSKNLGCYGDGGAIFTNDDNLAAEARCIANHGMVVRYHHDKIGVNSRLDSIQAAVLCVKLKYLNDYTKRRQAAADFYNKAFANCSWIKTPVCGSKSTHVFHQYTICLDESVDRDLLSKKLDEKGIPSMVYYPIPLHLQKAYLDERYKRGDFPVSEKLSQTVLSLPMHTELDNEQLAYITDNVCHLIEECRK
ncbi:MAG: DegT/DnrJ/EryC1/StrS family aminotransferase [Paludibacteraceae bacterium]|nr:DegT/DnrJ/EryC1/StrS family aminotransferase [Paludibacteraceae bacterium]